MTRPWLVNRPGPLVSVGDSLWCVDDDVPGLNGATRRMTIVKRPDGTLLFFNAIPLRDEQLREVEALGRPTSLIVPNHFHMLDAAAFAERLKLTVYGPEAGLQRIRERVPSVQPVAGLPIGSDLAFFTVDGFKTGEVVLVVRHGSTASMLAADLVCNSRHGRGLSGLFMRLVGFTADRPILPKPVRLRVGRNLQEVRALIERLASVDGLTRIIPSHGEIIASGAREALQAIATSL